MTAFFKLDNKIKHYPWGSAEHIPRFLGRENPSGEKWAELWMGIHPQGPSETLYEGENILLSDLIHRDPAALLGEKTAASFGNLPFLFKILAAEEPLSVQAHPNRDQARAGWERENALGIDLSAPNRSYKDPNHKPEILCALGPFLAMCGFREIAEIAGLLEKLRRFSPPSLKNGLADLAGLLSRGLKDFFNALLGLDRKFLSDLCGYVRENAALLAETWAENQREWELLASFAERYAGDPGILSPLCLNLLELQPGEAVFLPAGVLHAYIRGFALELMANSDNVLRCGLTSKYIDREELSRVLRYEPFKPEILLPPKTAFPWSAYPSCCPDFSLLVMEGRGGEEKFPPLEGSIGILTAGEGVFRKGGEEMRLKKGESAFFPPINGNSNNGGNESSITISGSYTLYIAGSGENVP